jgi:hypothetical protein
MVTVSRCFGRAGIRLIRTEGEPSKCYSLYAVEVAGATSYTRKERYGYCRHLLPFGS